MSTTVLIYLVDDGDDYRFLAKQVFTRFLSHYQIRFFSSGIALQQHVLTDTTEQPDLILLDGHMPGLNGLQTLSYLKQHPQWQSIPVIMVSSTTSQEEIDSWYKAGADWFRPKPTNLTEIREMVESACQYWRN